MDKMRKSFFGFVAEVAKTSVLAGVFVLLSISLLGIPSRTESQTSKKQIEQIKQDIQKGKKYTRRKQFKEAQECFNKILQQQPAAAYNNNVDLLAGKYASAMQKYWKALLYDETDTNIYFNLGIVNYLQMEITPKEVNVGGKKSKAPKEDWEACSKDAFDKAFFRK